jgi:hypothetical protein
LHDLGQRPSFWTSVRAHFIGQMGKYLPGKAWALFLRASLVRGHGARVGIAVATSFYEVLTTMTGGALLAALWFAWQAPDLHVPPAGQDFRRLFTAQSTPDASLLDAKVLLYLAVVLVLAVGWPIVPPVFNWLVNRIALPFREADAAPLPRFRPTALVYGLVLSSGSWLLMGASLGAALQAVLAEPAAWTLQTWGRYTAFVGLAYVAGFVIVLVPSGLGVREFLLLLMLVPEIRALPGVSETEGRALTVLAVVLLRLVWTAAEVVAVAVLYWLPPSAADVGTTVPARPS